MVVVLLLFLALAVVAAVYIVRVYNGLVALRAQRAQAVGRTSTCC